MSQRPDDVDPVMRPMAEALLVASDAADGDPLVAEGLRAVEAYCRDPARPRPRYGLAHELTVARSADPTTAESLRRATWSLLDDIVNRDVHWWTRVEFVRALFHAGGGPGLRAALAIVGDRVASHRQIRELIAQLDAAAEGSGT